MANYGREMRMGVDLRRKKDRKGNGVCRKNKEGIGGSRSSINKGIERDEETGGQRKEESRRMKSRR